MILTSLKLTNFRNYGSEAIDWSPGINMIRGENAQGKTNLLEAIAFLSTFSSFRGNPAPELIRKDRDFFLLRSCFQGATTEHTMNVAYSVDKKYLVRLDGNDKKRVAPLVGFLNTVVFSPDDLLLMKGRPEGRRRFIDNELIQTAPESYTLFRRYQKALRQRNVALKQMAETRVDHEVLNAFDLQLAESGSLILLRRREILERLQPLVRLAHRRITGGKEELLLEYEGSPELEIISARKAAAAELTAAFVEVLKAKRKTDLERRCTTFGPHRDDIRIYINEDDIRRFGSQGQQRTAALALKIGELELMKGQRGEYPLLLLDDVLSELDGNRREALIEVISGKIQTFITDTGDDTLFADCKEFRVTGGKLKEV